MTEAVLDTGALARLLEVMGGDPDDLDDILAEYRDGAPALVARMREAAAAGDPDAMRIAAHTLKSNARDVGALRLSARCAALEAACRDGGPDDADGAVAAIAGEETAARDALAALDMHDL